MTCNKSNHINGPDGYAARRNWSLKMAKTHQQVICPGCGELIWEIKKIPGTAEAWENGDLGRDERYVRVAD